MSIGASYTTFKVHYPESKLKGRTIYLRGDSCNLTWSKGVPMASSGTDEWSTALLCPENTTISVKALAN